MNEPATLRERRQSLVAIIVCIATFGVMLGLTSPLLSLILEARGIDRSLIGLNAAMPALAMLFISPFLPRIVRRCGFRRFLLGCLLVEFTTFLALPLFDHIYAWFIIRFVMGASTAGLFVVAETWINQIAEERNRGRVMGIYATVLSAGFAVGPLILAVIGTSGWLPFLVGAGFIALAVVPLALTQVQAPTLDGPTGFSIFQFIKMAPSLAGAVLLFAFLEVAIFALLPVYSVRSGIAETNAAIMLVVLTLGNVALQFPIGWLADRFNRYLIMTACASIAFFGALLLPLAIEWGALLWVFLFLWGGLFPGIYTVAMTILGQRFRGRDLMTANAAFGVLWGVGSLTGPAITGVAMDLRDPGGMPVTLSIVSGIFLLILLIRSRRRRQRRT